MAFQKRLTMKRKLKLLLELEQRDLFIPDDQRQDHVDVDSWQFQHTAEICDEGTQ